MLSADGAVTLGGVAAELTPLNGGDPKPGMLCSCEAETAVRELMQARLVTGLPILVVEDGKVTGKVGDAEIYDGLLGRS